MKYLYKYSVLSLIKVVMVLSLLHVQVSFADATQSNAQHRLPPVIYSVDIPQAVMPNESYAFKWSVMGYHNTYKVIIAIYDEQNKKLVQKTVSPYRNGTGEYSWGSIRSKEFFYSTNLNLSFDKSQELTIRFFASPVNDPYDNTYLSAIVPGGLGYEPADSTGRKIKIYGVTSTNEASWRTLFQNARVGDILLLAPEAGCEDGDCFNNSSYNGFGINIPYGYYRHAALVYEKDFKTGTLRLLHGRGPGYGVGADNESDKYSYEKLTDNSNWERISLFRVNNTSNIWAKKIMLDGYSDFNNTEYGIIFGTYCSELVEEVYEDYFSFDGATTYGLFLPDSIGRSSQTNILSVWTHPNVSNANKAKSEYRKGSIINDRLLELSTDDQIRLDIERMMNQQDGAE